MRVEVAGGAGRDLHCRDTWRGCAGRRSRSPGRPRSRPRAGGRRARRSLPRAARVLPEPGEGHQVDREHAVIVEVLRGCAPPRGHSRPAAGPSTAAASLGAPRDASVVMQRVVVVVVVGHRAAAGSAHRRSLLRFSRRTPSASRRRRATVRPGSAAIPRRPPAALRQPPQAGHTGQQSVGGTSPSARRPLQATRRHDLDAQPRPRPRCRRGRSRAPRSRSPASTPDSADGDGDRVDPRRLLRARDPLDLGDQALADGELMPYRRLHQRVGGEHRRRDPRRTASSAEIFWIAQPTWTMTMSPGAIVSCCSRNRLTLRSTPFGLATRAQAVDLHHLHQMARHIGSVSGRRGLPVRRRGREVMICMARHERTIDPDQSSLQSRLLSSTGCSPKAVEQGVPCQSQDRVLVMGLGNPPARRRRGGALAVDALAASGSDRARGLSRRVVRSDWRCCRIEDALALIAVDAARFGARPGITVRVFGGAAMDAQLGGCKRSAHGRARRPAPARRRSPAGCRHAGRWSPSNRPASNSPSVPTPAVAAALPRPCAAVDELLDRWTNELRRCARRGRRASSTPCCATSRRCSPPWRATRLRRRAVDLHSLPLTDADRDRLRQWLAAARSRPRSTSPG